MNFSTLGNPIFTRESRSRFRAPLAFALLLLYAALLALVTVFLYDATFGGAQEFATVYTGPPGFASSFSPTPTPATLGRELFFKLALAQLVAWMLLAPALAATSLSGERERGLLEGVQLSRLAPRQIVGGKLAAVLSLIALLLPITLPMFATCFLLGGVAPSELFQALALQISTAVFGASLGLFFSARARRAQASLASALVTMGAIGFLTYLSFNEWRSGARLFGGTSDWSAKVWEILATLAAWFGPQNALEMLHREYSLAVPTLPPVVTLTPLGPVARPATAPFASLLGSAPMWVWTCGLQLLVSAILLFFATRALRRPMPELTPDDTRWTDFARRALVKWQSEQEARRAAMLAQQEQQRAAKLSDGAARAGAALLYELPLHHFVNFRDPMLRREVRNKFRWRRTSLWVALGQLLALLVLLAFYASLLYAVFAPQERAGTLQIALGFTMIVSMAACGVMGASTLTRERESGTWESLRLSLLRPAEIVRAKVMAPLVACFYYAIPLWIVLPFFVQLSAAPRDVSNPYGAPPSGTGFWNNGVPLLQVLAILFVIALAALFCSSVGLLMSALCRKTIAAIGGTLIALAAFFGALPTLLDVLPTYFGYYNLYGGNSYGGDAEHPISSAIYLVSPYVMLAMDKSGAARVLAIHAAIMIVLCAAILFAVTLVLARRRDETR